MNTANDHIQAKRVTIVRTNNKFARGDIGKKGVVSGMAPFGMVIVLLDEGGDFWAYPENLKVVE